MARPTPRRARHRLALLALAVMAMAVLFETTIPFTTTAAHASGAPAVRHPAKPRADENKYYVVQTTKSGRPETLFRISQRYLGSGNRFREIFDLNKGQVQPDGKTVSDPQVLAPGWILRLPGDARGIGVVVNPNDEILLAASREAAGAVTPTETPAETPTEAPAEQPIEDPTYYVVGSVEGGPASLFDIAERFLGSGDRAGEIFTLNHGREQPGGRVLNDPDEIRDGWLLLLPPDAAGDGVQIGPLPTLEELNAINAEATEVDGDAEDADSAQTSERWPPRLWWLVGGGIALATIAAGLAAGLLRPRGSGTTDSLRGAGARSRIRWPWRRNTKPLGARREDAGIWTIDRAARVLATACAAAGRSVPEVYAVTVDDDTFRLRLTGPDPQPPDGWSLADGARTWSIPLRLVQSANVDTEVESPFPQLVSLGDSDDGRVLIDLSRAHGVVSLEGESSAALVLADRWVSELATSPWSGRVAVVRVGQGDGDGPPARARADDLDRAEASLAELGTGVLVISGARRADATRIAELAGDPQRPWTVIVVDGANSPARWRLSIDASGRVVGGPLHIPVHAHHRLLAMKPA